MDLNVWLGPHAQQASPRKWLWAKECQAHCLGQGRQARARIQL